MLDTDLSPKVVGKISYQFDITDTMINDILITAIEGGINQWCTEVGSVGDDLSLTPGSHLGHGGKLQFTLVEQDGYRILTLSTFLTALGRFCQEQNYAPPEFHEQHDAADADIVVQYALFGELVYS